VSAPVRLPSFLSVRLIPGCLLVCAAACGSPSGPGKKVEAVQPLTLTCPSNITIENVVGANRAVQFAAPAAAGGVAPVAVSCAPASGVAFPLGTTTVACQASDAAAPARTAVCQLTVTLVPYVPVLSLTRFMAFGDSITEGEINDETGACVQPSVSALKHDLAGLLNVQRSRSYPADLAALLAARYTTQTFVVQNEGLGADSTTDGVPRFVGVTRRDAPEAVLLLQGVIDLSDSWPTLDGVPVLIGNLDADIVEARRQGAQQIFLSTLLPTVQTFRGCYVTSAQIQAANAEIRALASREHVTLVDSYSAFAGRESTLIGSDGLHPTVLGYQVLAQTFFGVIKDTLEQAPAESSLARPDVEVRPHAPRPSIGIRHPQ